MIIAFGSKLCLSIVSLSILAAADFECLCNYRACTNVFPTTNNQTTVIGELYEFDCKPTYQIPTKSGWQVIQYNHTVGYVVDNEQIEIQTCPGKPAGEDLVITGTPLTASKSSFPTTTRRTLLPTTVIRKAVPSTSAHDASSTSGNYYFAFADSASKDSELAIFGHPFPKMADKETTTFEHMDHKKSTDLAQTGQITDQWIMQTTVPTHSAYSTESVEYRSLSTGRIKSQYATARSSFIPTKAENSRAYTQERTSMESGSTETTAFEHMEHKKSTDLAKTGQMTYQRIMQTTAPTHLAYSTEPVEYNSLSTGREKYQYASAKSSFIPTKAEKSRAHTQEKTLMGSETTETATIGHIEQKTTDQLVFRNSETTQLTNPTKAVDYRISSEGKDNFQYTSIDTESSFLPTRAFTQGITLNELGTSDSIPQTYLQTTEMSTGYGSGKTYLCPYIVKHYTQMQYLSQYGNYCFELCPYQNKDWMSANYYCTSNSGSLVIISNQNVQQHLEKFLNYLKFNYLVWIGLHDLQTEGLWQWVDGSSVSYENWSSNRHDPVYGTEQDCALLDAKTGKWQETVCKGFLMDYQRHPWICQYKI